MGIGLSQNHRERRMSSTHQAGNEGKLGFYPTDLSVVDLEMRLIDFSDLLKHKEEVNLNICDLTGGTGEQLNHMKEYLNNLGISNYQYYVEYSKKNYEKCLENYEFTKMINEDTTLISIGRKEGKALKKEVMSIIRNNPPYGYVQVGFDNERQEKIFFKLNNDLNMVGGIQIFECNLSILPVLLRDLISGNEIFIAKFPKKIFDNSGGHKQVVVFCKKKQVKRYDCIIEKEIRESIENDDLPWLDEVKGPVFSLTYEEVKNFKEINYYRNPKITEETLNNGLNEVIGDLLNLNIKESNIEPVKKIKPLMKLSAGHMSTLLASGAFDGQLGNLLVKGGHVKSKKNIVTETKDKTISENIDVIKPYLELTNKDGDILYKIL